MFTGIIEEVGQVRDAIPRGQAMRFRIEAPKTAATLRPGDSVACNGVCLTAEEVLSDGFTATAVPETLSRTALGALRAGARINLEAALKAGNPMGGHIVQGHVDGIALVLENRALARGEGRELKVRIPPEHARYCVEKGSFALHGVSLTIAAVEGDMLRFALVPHTLAHTNLEAAAPGDALHFEVDIVGKYVEKLLAHQGKPAAAPGAGAGNATAAGTLDAARLGTWGYGV